MALTPPCTFCLGVIFQKKEGKTEVFLTHLQILMRSTPTQTSHNRTEVNRSIQGGPHNNLANMSVNAL